jgi:hypothetical protein
MALCRIVQISSFAAGVWAVAAMSSVVGFVWVGKGRLCKFVHISGRPRIVQRHGRVRDEDSSAHLISA